MSAAPSTSSARLRTACLLAAALAAIAVALTAGGDARPALATVPELPLAVAEAHCSASDPATAEARALGAAALADRHMARYPYAAEEGLRALALLAEARDCLALAGAGAGRTGAAAQAATSADASLAARAERYRARLVADYRDRVTRVRRALAARRPGVLGPGWDLSAIELELVRDDVDDLLALLAGSEAAFVAELRGLQLELGADSSAQAEAP